MLFVGELRKWVSGAPCVLVGGSLVEFFTGGQYVSGDIDLIGDRDAIGKALVSAGFEREGRHFTRDDLHLFVEVPKADLRAGERTTIIEFEDRPVEVVSLEDLIVDRLLAAKFWASRTDREQAILLLAAHADRLDRARLKARARVENVEDELASLAALLGDTG
ncbi:MAG TPA: hypothetical protein VM370_06255 [Candidatus Thermoplasmatota archaeon]|nr:hypothetical protein [Candidatus Thermoplasmatota archaeon]